MRFSSEVARSSILPSRVARLVGMSGILAEHY
jgi:hypothetical protein